MDDLLRKTAQYWQEADWSVAVFLCAAYFAIDAMNVYYLNMVAARRPVQAANISFAMHFFIAIGVLSYTHNPFYILPVATGSWIGTYWFTLRSRRSQDDPPLPPPSA